MVAPIISNDEVIGVFDLESDELDAYAGDDLEVLKLLASQVAIIIEKVMLHEQLIEKKRLQGQLEVARQVQLELLPPSDPNSKVLISVLTTIPRKKYRVTITIGCGFMTTRSDWLSLTCQVREFPQRC